MRSDGICARFGGIACGGEIRDDHQGVTLKYTLSYKEEEHLIVIPGGGKYASPEIPWYGPEYLIGKFGR